MLVAQSGPTLCDPMDCSLPGSSVSGIFWARTKERSSTNIRQLGNKARMYTTASNAQTVN